MSECRSNERNSVSNNFFTAKNRLEDRLNNLMASLTPELRAGLTTLFDADTATRTKLLATMDPKTKELLTTALACMKK